MGVNSGRFHGVGIRRVVAPTFLGTVTIKPPPNLPTVGGLLLQSVQGFGTTEFATSIFSIYSKSGALVFNIPIAGGPATYGGQLAAGTLANGFFGLDGTTNPPSIKAPNGTRMYIGTGAMIHSTFPNVVGAVGDLYARQTGAALFVLQQCTVAGTPGTSPGTWTTIAS